MFIARKVAMRNLEEVINDEKLTEDEKYRKADDIISLSGDDAVVRNQYIFELMETIVLGFHKYTDFKSVRNGALFQNLEKHIRGFKDVPYLYLAFIDLFYEKKESSLKNIELSITTSSDPIGYTDLLNLVRYFKQGFQGMWTAIGRVIGSTAAIPCLENACYALEAFYFADSQEEIVNTLSKVIIEDDKIHFAKELIGFTYYSMHMWENAIAYFEKALDISLFDRIFEEDELHYYLAWSYGKVKDYINEELNYKKLLSIDSDGPVLNNFGYCLYRQRRFTEAKKVFAQCIMKKIDLRYAVNNMLRVLIACGEDNEAREFAQKYQQIVSKGLVKNIGKGKKARVVSPTNDDTFSNEDLSIQAPPTIDIGKGQQFSSEKILEDEITHRIERGDNCFGVQLSIYKQKGKYGRQFIMPVGRVDILANDAEGNLYAIELKRDSGYCDVFSQVSRYVGWLEENLIHPEKKVYGIIVVNKPSDELRMKVRSNPKMRLYDYSVMYQEII